PSGTSSYVITSGLVGYIEGVAATSVFSDSNTLPPAVGGVGALGGATFAGLTAPRLGPDPGGAPLFNSGAGWGAGPGGLFAGALSGGLFAVVFGLPKRTTGAIVLGGLNAGVVTGALMARRYDVSRRHAALVDLAGLAGMAVGVSLESAIDAQRSDTVEGERVA